LCGRAQSEKPAQTRQQPGETSRYSEAAESNKKIVSETYENRFGKKTSGGRIRCYGFPKKKEAFRL
jgi:hypothetical protein